MKTLVVYDSAYGNTEKVAQVLYETAMEFGDAKLLQAGDLKQSDLTHIDTLFIGAPTQGGRPTAGLQAAINQYAAAIQAGVRVAAFDTRLDSEAVNRWLRLLMKTIGYAAPKIAKSFQKQLGCVVEDPEGFIVHDKEGPLRDGELRRASQWVRHILEKGKI